MLGFLPNMMFNGSSMSDKWIEQTSPSGHTDPNTSLNISKSSGTQVLGHIQPRIAPSLVKYGYADKLKTRAKAKYLFAFTQQYIKMQKAMRRTFATL